MFTARSVPHPVLRATVRLLFVAVVVGGWVLGCGGDGGTGPEPGDTPPPVPSGLTATDQVEAVSMEWNAVSSANLQGYNVYRATSSFDDVDGRTPVNDAPLGDPQFRDGGVDAGTAYTYRVTAVSTAGAESAPSGALTVTVFASPPGRP
jgi:TolB protein